LIAAWAGICSFLPAGCSSQPKQPIEDYLSGLVSRGALTGAVLVARGNTVLASGAYGLANEESGIRNTAETRFRIGSNTKQFTAMAILILQDRGRLNVGDSICDYISSCPAAWQTITLFHLLTHTSGIPNYTDFDDFSSLLGTPVTVDGLIDRFRTRPLDFSPGARWSYTNSGYVLLGAVVERVSQQGYADFLQQNIFAPLGMQTTGYDANDPPISTHATGYLTPGVKAAYFDMSEVYAAGALYSTVGDLYLWDQALLSNRLIPEASLKTMTSPQVPCPSGWMRASHGPWIRLRLVHRRRGRPLVCVSLGAYRRILVVERRVFSGTDLGSGAQ
jgi:CubicO group peptidase (beta-lactamase class C family)